MKETSRRKLFVDVSALLEVSWTGIANVTANLARELLIKSPYDVFFFVNDRVVDPATVLTACDAPGGYIHPILSNGYGDVGHISQYLSGKGRSIGLYPNLKRSQRAFDHEIVVMHDLSAMLMPELHQEWAAHEHTKAMAEDCASSDLICCVSKATQEDVEVYLPGSKGKTFVSHLGVNPLVSELPRTRLPFVLVLGTIEPRKNLALVANYMVNRPELAKRLAFVFVGRPGWGDSFNTVFSQVLSHPAWTDRVAFAGYLDEQKKWDLLRSAQFAIFPSLFEGFGLPVIESMAAGCPIVASRSSSLVEFELGSELYFDPFSLSEFSRAFKYLETRTDAERAVIGARLQAQSERYTWGAFVARIIEAAETRLS